MNLHLSGETALYPVIGDPVAQVRSPGQISSILAARHLNAIVVPVHVAAHDVGPLISAFSAVRNIRGLLVTVPHKAAAYTQCARTSERARFVRSINVMRSTNAGWVGDNTDGAGYADALEAAGFSMFQKSALLVGCGGAGAAIAFELLERGVSELAIHDIDGARRDDLVSRLAARFGSQTGAVVRAGDTDPRGFDLVANASPLGMRAGDPLPVDTGRLQQNQFVACVITSPKVPRLIAEARLRGCSTVTGGDMFDAQAGMLVDFLLSNEVFNA